MITKAYIADRIFTGQKSFFGHAVVTRSEIIIDVVPVTDLPDDIEKENFPNCFIAPAFIDLQIYGAYGKLFAVYPETDALHKLNQFCREGGATYCLPTVATNEKQVFHKCIDAIREYWSQGGQGILGLHVEGPWISKTKRGAHIESLIYAPALQDVEELLNYGKGIIKMITLAPEVCSKEVIDCILSEGIVISAGHSNATYNQAMAGFEWGIRTVTHLYNAMSGLQHREPGLVGAAFEHSGVRASIIPDGHHVDFSALRIAKKVMGERLFAITDAVTETHEGYYQHNPVGDKYEAAGILSGSALTMSGAVKNLVEFGGIELAEALRMCSLYPAHAAGLSMLGRIEKNHKVNMVVMNNNMEVQTIIG